MFRHFFLICFLSISLYTYSQEKVTLSDIKTPPLSIYAERLPQFMSNFEFEASSNLLSLNDLNFLLVNQQNIERNIFTIDLRNFGRNASVYDYQSYRKADLNKYFDVVPDIVVLNRFSRSSIISNN